MVVSLFGRAVQLPSGLPFLTWIAVAAGGGEAGCESGSVTGLENCLTSCAESVSWAPGPRPP